MFATVLGFVIGISRLSKNWLLAKAAGGYVETIRNIPLLLQLAVLVQRGAQVAAARARQLLVIPGGGYLNNRGLFLPKPVLQSEF